MLMNTTFLEDSFLIKWQSREAGACIAAIDTAAPASASYAVRPAGEAAAVLPVPGP